MKRNDFATFMVYVGFESADTGISPICTKVSNSVAAQYTL